MASTRDRQFFRGRMVSIEIRFLWLVSTQKSTSERRPFLRDSGFVQQFIQAEAASWLGLIQAFGSTR